MKLFEGNVYWRFGWDQMSEDFERRYLLARYSTGGVVVDLESGNYYRVNASAALACDALRAGGDAAGRVASALGIPLEEATQVVDEVAVSLATPAVRGAPQGSYHFHPADGDYVLRHGERTVLEVDGADLSIRLPAKGDPPQEAQLELYVRALAPKLLFQRGATVLHASACVVKGRLIAFAGISGAGKTTIARAFVAAGAHLISEDLVVLAPGPRAGRVLLNAEGSIQTWAQQVASRLLLERRQISSKELSDAIAGPTKPIERIMFLDSARRTGDRLIGRSLAEPDALAALMAHDFLGAAEPQSWRRFFACATALIAVITAEEVSSPDGVDRLPAAVARYISSTAS